MRRPTAYRQMEKRSRWSAWLLLAVYVPMVFMSLTHVHYELDSVSTVDCSLCDSNVHHSGHLTSISQHHDDCLFCRLLSVQLTIATDKIEAVVRPLVDIINVFCPEACTTRSLTVVSLRGPPCIL